MLYSHIRFIFTPSALFKPWNEDTKNIPESSSLFIRHVKLQSVKLLLFNGLMQWFSNFFQ